MTDRFSHPAAEKKYVWLKTVLDTYHISDTLVDEQIAALQGKGQPPACHRGCYVCCMNSDVPITEPELLGISWYASEVLAGELRGIVKQRLFEHEATTECPFLVEGACSIYPVRPLICRQFYVASKACAPGEDILSSRMKDIVIFPKDVYRQVAMRLLDHYGIQKLKAKTKAFESGFIPDHARSMHEYDWTLIARTMELFDAERRTPKIE